MNFLSIYTITLCFVATSFAQEQAPNLDWNKAKQLLERQKRGDTLNNTEAAYLDRARDIRRKQYKERRIYQQRKKPDRLIPLTDIEPGSTYEGQAGGLYGEGKNDPPNGLIQAVGEQLKHIVPRNDHGEPDPKGLVGLISISMSNATMEFSRFKQQADRSPDKSPQVKIVDCAQGGKAMSAWARADAPPWDVAAQRLKRAGVAPDQVQVAWIKLANPRPEGSLEDHVSKLESDTIDVLQHARGNFPNLRVAYLSSRIWGGEAGGNLSPEPYAYESAFAVQRLVLRQLKGDKALATEEVPVILWGPYLWAEGDRGRKTDDLTWLRTDFAEDGVHPSDSGRNKVANLLLNFFTHDPLARPWFAK